MRPSTSATVMAVALVCVCAAWLVGARGNGWTGEFLRSRATIFFGVLGLGSLALLYVLLGTMWRLGRQRRSESAAAEQAGTAALEFCLIFPLALTIVLVMIQSMLLVAGNLSVHYAACAAARAAVVWVPEELSYEEPRNVVGEPEYSAKMHRIRSAAVFAVLPVSASKPGAGGAVGPGGAVALERGFDRFYSLYGTSTPNWVRTMLSAKYRYAWDYTEVELAPPRNGAAFADHEDLHVTVRHTFYLSVPFANRIFGRQLLGGTGDYGTLIQASYALTNQGIEDDIDVEQFPRQVGRGGT